MRRTGRVTSVSRDATLPTIDVDRGNRVLAIMMLPIVTEDELRRYLRYASVLLATASLPTSQRLAILRRARHWLGAVTCGVDQLIREAAGAEDDEEALTAERDLARIQG